MKKFKQNKSEWHVQHGDFNTLISINNTEILNIHDTKMNSTYNLDAKQATT